MSLASSSVSPGGSPGAPSQASSGAAPQAASSSGSSSLASPLASSPASGSTVPAAAPPAATRPGSSPRPDTRPTAARNAFLVYVGRIREFDRTDWLVYTAWIGTMFGLVFATAFFLFTGWRAGVRFPAEAFLIPVGALLFSLAIAVDTIGHRTVYKEVLRGGEALVHHITIFCGVSSVVLLVLAFDVPSLWIPAMALTVLSFVYSLVDEIFHWRRYISASSDPVEMWSHVGILLGHSIMMIAWWRFFQLGYPGVAETLVAMGVR
jgi:hypothetical protein